MGWSPPTQHFQIPFVEENLIDLSQGMSSGWGALRLRVPGKIRLRRAD